MPTLPAPEPAARPRLIAFAPWQAALLAIGAGGVACTALLAPAPLLAPHFRDHVAHPVAVALFGTGIAVAGTWGLVHLAGVRPAAIFLRRPDWSVIGWAGTAFVLAAVVFAAAWHDPGLTVAVQAQSRPHVLARLLAAAAIGVWSGTVEELLLRGVLLAMIGQRWRWDGAIVVTALGFGLLHTGAGASPLATAMYVTLTTVAGVLFGLVVVANGTVWPAVALHASWNAAFAPPILGVEPSRPPSAILALRGAPGWLLGTNAATIPESPLAILLYGTVCGGYWLWLRRRDRLSNHARDTHQ